VTITCYVCGRPIVLDYTLRNYPVNCYPKHPESNSLARHAYCGPGSVRYANRFLSPRRKRDAFWARILGFTREGGAWVRPED